MSRRALWLPALVACLTTPPVAAQQIRGRVVERATGAVVTGGFAVLVDEGGMEVARALTDGRGGFALVAPRPGTYRVRSERSRLLTVRIFRYRRALKSDLSVEEEEGSFEIVSGSRPFNTEDPERLEAEGYVWIDRSDAQFFGPDAHLLLSDAFLDGHCFRLVDSQERPDQVGLAFRPVADSVPNLEGVRWADRGSAELRRLEFTFVHLPVRIEVKHMGGEITFRRVPDGAWVVTAWYLRAPVIKTRRRRQHLDGYIEEGAELVEVLPRDST